MTQDQPYNGFAGAKLRALQGQFPIRKLTLKGLAGILP